MYDPTLGVNPHQSVEGMVAEYNKKQEAEEARLHDPDLCDTPKEEMEVNREAERYVARGRLDPETGAEIPLTPKARKVASWVPSEAFLNRYDLIKWD